jgi:hypothetical protein
MKDKYVYTCECCGEKYSEITTHPTSTEYLDHLIVDYKKVMYEHGMEGELSLLIVGEMIYGFKYCYKNKREIRKAKQFCKRMELIALCNYDSWLEVLIGDALSNNDTEENVGEYFVTSKGA